MRTETPHLLRSLLLLGIGFSTGFFAAWFFITLPPPPPSTAGSPPSVLTGKDHLPRFSGMQTEDLSSLLDQSAAAPVFSARLAMLNTLFAEHGGEDPQRIAAWLLACDSPALVAESVGAFVRAWAALDPHAAALWVGTKLGSEAQIRAGTALVEEWVKSDPESAMAWAGSLPSNFARAETFSSLFRAWGTLEPAAAIAAARTAGEEAGEAPVADSLIGIANRSLAEAHLFAAREFATHPSELVLDRFIAETGFVDPVGTLRFLAELPDSLDIDSAIGVTAAYHADGFPSLALDWALDQPGDLPERSSIIGGVVTSIAIHDPSRMRATIPAIADANDLSMVVAEALPLLASDEPRETATWIRSLPPGAMRDKVLTAFFRGFDSESLEASETRSLIDLAGNESVRASLSSDHLPPGPAAD